MKRGCLNRAMGRSFDFQGKHEVDIDEGGWIMAEWVCNKCGYVRDSRCKPKKCPNCDAQNAFEKKEEGGKK